MNDGITMANLIATLACMVNEIGKMMQADGGIDFLRQENEKMVNIVIKLNDVIKERQKKEKRVIS